MIPRGQRSRVGYNDVQFSKLCYDNFHSIVHLLRLRYIEDDIEDLDTVDAFADGLLDSIQGRLFPSAKDHRGTSARICDSDFFAYAARRARYEHNLALARLLVIVD